MLVSIPKDVLRERARVLRNNPTGAEHHLRKLIRTFSDERLRRQLVLGNLIIDLALPKRNLLIEVDGPSHQESSEKDFRRDSYLQSLGFNVLRLTNEQILKDSDYVIERIRVFAQSEKAHAMYKASCQVARQRHHAQVNRQRVVDQTASVKST